MGAVGWIVLGTLVVAVLSVWVAYRRFLETADGRALLATRRGQLVAIADVPEGASAKIAGTVQVAAESLDAPLSRRPCVCWRVTVERWRPGSANCANSWEPLIDEACATDFFVVDATGRARVCGAGVQAVLKPDEHYGKGAIENEQTTPELEAFLRRAGQSLGDRPLRYTEAVVAEGDNVQLVGCGHWELDSDPAARPSDYRKAARRLVLDRTEGEKVALTKPSADDG